MAVPLAEQRKVAMLSGNRCAFEECRVELAAVPPGERDVVVLGEMAHIVADSPQGPRGGSPLTPTQRNEAENLLLLCNRHHQLVDSRTDIYTVAKLQAIKDAHEAWVRTSLNARACLPSAAALPSRHDTVYSSLLPVTRMPSHIYGAPCESRYEREVRPAARDGSMLPFILRGGMLWAFQDLRDGAGPFAALVDATAAEEHAVGEWCFDPDRFRWFQTLLNRSLNKLTGRRGLHLDAQHGRYYFPAVTVGTPRTQTYRPLNQATATRSVVWQPTKKATGEGRGYWLHRAVSLKFDRVTDTSWVLSIRPELRVTSDGVEPLASEAIGRRVTRKKSRQFNYDLLGEVQFWRDFLSDSKPRIVFNYGRERARRLVVSTNLISAEVCWPGIPEEHAMPFTNVEYLDDLFTWGEEEVEDRDSVHDDLAEELEDPSQAETQERSA
jgi:hypothetical protein